jgi:hypothetical protein
VPRAGLNIQRVGVASVAPARCAQGSFARKRRSDGPMHRNVTRGDKCEGARRTGLRAGVRGRSIDPVSTRRVCSACGGKGRKETVRHLEGIVSVHTPGQRCGKGDRHLLPERPFGCFAQKVPVTFSAARRFRLHVCCTSCNRILTSRSFNAGVPEGVSGRRLASDVASSSRQRRSYCCS